MTRSQTAGLDYEERCRRAAVDCEAKREVYHAALELRDRLVVEGIDTGRTIRQVADANLISLARVHQIMARRG